MPIPKCPNAPALTGSDSKNIESTVQLVTPMFGGGVVAREVDETHPIRKKVWIGALTFRGLKHQQLTVSLAFRDERC